VVGNLVTKKSFGAMVEDLNPQSESEKFMS
jgi:hypothetical protein